MRTGGGLRNVRYENLDSSDNPEDPEASTSSSASSPPFSVRIWLRESKAPRIALFLTLCMVIALVITRTAPSSGGRGLADHDSTLDLVKEESLPSNLDEIIEAVLEDEVLIDIENAGEGGDDGNGSDASEQQLSEEGLTREEKAGEEKRTLKDETSAKKAKKFKLHIPPTKRKYTKKQKEAFKKAVENDPLGLKDTPLTREQWLKLQEYEQEVMEEQKDLQRRMDTYNGLLEDGDWYWSKARRFTKKKSQCFWTANITANPEIKKYRRSADFSKPIEGHWVYAKQDLPIYWSSFPGTPTDKCFTTRESLRQVIYTREKNKKKNHLVVMRDYDCADESKCTRLHFKPKECDLLGLFDVRLAATLRRRRVFFVGDYSMKQQYENMLCVLSPLMWPNMKPKHLEKGARTGLKGEACVLWNKDTEIHFLYAGFYKQKGSKKSSHKDGIYEIADVLRERRENFRPTDVVLANIGNDYGDSKTYKQSLLKFLRTYEDIKGDANAPMIVWRESSAQHHSGHVGGDILRPLSSWNAAEQGSVPQAQLERSMKEKEKIYCHAIRGDELLEGNWRNDMANRLMESAGIPILRIWKSTSMKWNWYRGYCKDSDLPEAKGAHCERWGPCKHHCNPGVVTSFNELFLTFVDSPVISKNLRQREKTLQPSANSTVTEAKSYHRILAERMMKVFLNTNEIWPFNNQAQINPGAGEKVKWDKLEHVNKKEEKYWNEKRKEAEASDTSKAEYSEDKSSTKKSSHKKNG